MNWDCAQLDARLAEYLEGQLEPAELRAADAHARACPRCAEHFLARRAVGLLHQMDPLESPPGLETRILALTVAPPPRESLWAMFAGAWRAFQQPRMALSLAAAVVSVALVLNAFGVSLRDIRPSDLSPVSLYRGAKRQAHLTYARGSRFVNDLRLVYEIRSRLEEIRPATEPAPAAPSKTPDSPAPENKQPEKPREGARVLWLLAYYNFIAPGELR
ncbi:MAG: zf-HC2 domain-containing protein [Acidobacteria bacterium]|nr:zf-HC2 domain-containing protein [Acidobacteriota bacterium]